MTDFDYQNAAYPIRGDLVNAHRFAWRAIAGPGDWWSGAQRVAIAEEVRRVERCALCAERKAALSPYAVEGEHDHGGVLPARAVEAIHRITSDPARLKKSWYEELLSGEFTDAHYVEMVGILVTIVCIDAVHRALGLPLEPLPAPDPGQPRHYRPTTAVSSDQAWVPMISARAAQGTDEEDLYPGGRTGNVIMAMSLVPDAVRMLNATQKAHYIDIMNAGFDGEGGRAISRPQIELIAARVSALNDCFY